ncbi:hypothetical protein [Mesorhizobium sp. B2-1-3A]|uniref:hypothetical protein n=1 Tax=Mesorhizobium sp. B2-1-3A TaxID=2589971 RepID=UPI00112E9740|nr:hypothetical protein [Mesorhizobium sp. B2-1-3A]TPM90941.1 hypothetical protein FJ977_33170 [Mesorhizobium sp. B2-1-3A]
MISKEIDDLLAGPVMILVSTRNAAFRPAIGRGTGAAHVASLGCIDVLVSRTQWPEVVENAALGAPVAVTMVRPHDYRAFQVKGSILAVSPADDADRARAQNYISEMLVVMEALGVTPHQLSHTLVDSDLLRIRFQPTDVFSQSPGPGAGERLRTNSP